MASPSSKLPPDIESVLSLQMQPFETAGKIQQLVGENPRWSVVSSSDPRIETIRKQLEYTYQQGMIKAHTDNPSLFAKEIKQAPLDQKIKIATEIFRLCKKQEAIDACDITPDQTKLIWNKIAEEVLFLNTRIQEYDSKSQLKIILSIPGYKVDEILNLLRKCSFDEGQWLALAKASPAIYVSACAEGVVPQIDEKILSEAIVSSESVWNWVVSPRTNALISSKECRQYLYEQQIKKDPQRLLTEPLYPGSFEQKLEIAEAYAAQSNHYILELSDENRMSAFDFLLDPRILDVLLSRMPHTVQEQFRASLTELQSECGGLYNFLNRIKQLSEESASTLQRFQPTQKDENTPPDAQTWECLGSAPEGGAYRFFKEKKEEIAPPFPAVESPLSGWRYTIGSASPLPPHDLNSDKIQGIFEQSTRLHLIQALGFAVRDDGVLMIPSIDEINRRLAELTGCFGSNTGSIAVIDETDDPSLDVDKLLIEGAPDLRLLLSRGEFNLHDMQVHVLGIALLQIRDAVFGTSHLKEAQMLLQPVKKIESWLSAIEEQVKMGKVDPDQAAFIGDYVPYWRTILAASLDVILTYQGMVALVESELSIKDLMSELFFEEEWTTYFKERFPLLVEQNPQLFTPQEFDKITEKLKSILPWPIET